MFYEQHHLITPDYFKKEYGENFSFPSHLHYCFELVVIIDGEMTVKIDSKDHTLIKNDAVLVFPNPIHSYHTEQSRHLCLIFTPALIQAFSVKRRNVVPKNNGFALDEGFVKILEKLDADSSVFEIKGALYSICGILEKGAEYMPAVSDNDDLLFKIFSFVNENFAGECSLKQLSSNTG